MIFCIEIPKESLKVEQINEFSEVEGHRLIYRNQFYSCILAMNTWTMELKIQHHLTSLVAQTVKRLSTMWETWVRSLGWEDPLEKEMAVHSRTIAWKIPWTEEPGRLESMGLQTVRHD